MAQRSIILLGRFGVGPEQLFEVLADHERMSDWTGTKVTVLAGPPDGGVGTVRRIHTRGVSFDEEVVVFDRPRRFVYRVIRGAPFDYHRGEVLVRSWGQSGSEVLWTIDLSSKIPGVAELVVSILRPALNEALRKLAASLPGQAA